MVIFDYICASIYFYNFLYVQIWAISVDGSIYLFIYLSIYLSIYLILIFIWNQSNEIYLSMGEVCGIWIVWMMEGLCFDQCGFK